LSAVRDRLFNIFAATPHVWRLFLHPQSKENLGLSFFYLEVQL